MGASICRTEITRGHIQILKNVNTQNVRTRNSSENPPRSHGNRKNKMRANFTVYCTAIYKKIEKILSRMLLMVNYKNSQPKEDMIS